MARFDQLIGSQRDELGAQIADLRAQIGSTVEETAQITATVVQAAVVDGTYTPTYTGTKKDKFVQVTLRFADFGAAYDLKVVMVAAADVVDADTYVQKRFHTKLADKIDDNGRATGLWTPRLDVFLEWNTLYYIISIVSIGANENDRAFNPSPDPLYAGFPGNAVYSFTTPLEPGVIQAGGPNIINGGGMMHSEEQYTVLEGGASVLAEQDYLGRRWEVNAGAGTRIDRLAPGAGGSYDNFGMAWADKAAFMVHKPNQHHLGGHPSAHIGRRIIAGESYTFSALVSANNTGVVGPKLVVNLIDVADIITLAFTPNDWVFAVFPEWTLFVAVLRVPTDFEQSGKQWVSFFANGDLDDPNEWFTAKWKLERGENVSPWTPHQQETLLDSQSNITDPGGHGSFGQTTGGIYDREGTKFFGPDGALAGEFKR